ncbi:DNA primase [Rhodovibrionaceae bacterium A322]
MMQNRGKSSGMGFTPEFLDELRANVSLVDLVGRQVRLTKRGREFVGLSPFNKEKSPSFYVVPDKGFYHCFSSGEHGDAIGWVMKVEGLSFPEAVEKLAGEAGLQVPKATPAQQAAEKKRASLHEVLEAATAWYQQQLTSAQGRGALEYLENRGLSRGTIARFRLGYAPNQRGVLRKALNARGIDDQLMVDAGLLKRPDDGGPLRDYFFDRAMFPITDRRGRVVAFGGRALNPESKAKYLNSPDSQVFHKGKILYNLANARQAAHDGAEVVVCEGYMDVIALAQAGFPAAVAPLGTAVTEQQITELWRMVPEPIICLDGDAAGQRAGQRAAERALPLLRPGQSLRFATLPAGEDPDSLVQAQGTEAFQAILDRARPLSDLIWRSALSGGRFDTPERQAGLKKELLDKSDLIEDASVKEAYRRALLQRYDEAFGFKSRGWQGKGGRFPAKGKGAGGRFGARGPASGSGLPTPPRQSPVLLQQRPEQVLLALVINHPAVSQDHLEELSGLAFSRPEHERLLESLVDGLLRLPDLDRSAVKCHLCDLGYAELLEKLLNRSIYLHEPLARPDAPIAEVRKRFGYWVQRVREAVRRPEEQEAVRRLAEETSDEQLDRVRAERAIHEEKTAQQRVIERFETANTGRN